MNSSFLAQFLLTLAFLVAAAAAWWGFSNRRQRRFGRAHASARIRGSCGDVMEIRLTFENGKLKQGGQWVNGCAWSHLCLSAAVACARGKTPMEMRAMEKGEIVRRVEGLPADHDHCAELAHKTVQAAVENFFRDHPAGMDKPQPQTEKRR
jgi:nitrogen fixation protein NifU and related proteins